MNVYELNKRIKFFRYCIGKIWNFDSSKITKQDILDIIDKYNKRYFSIESNVYCGLLFFTVCKQKKKKNLQTKFSQVFERKSNVLRMNLILRFRGFNMRRIRI